MRRLVGRAPLILGRGWVPPATILLALLLVSPSLGVGPMADDYMHMARVDPRLHVPGFAYAPLDLFTFASGDPVAPGPEGAHRVALASDLDPAVGIRGRPPGPTSRRRAFIRP
jgi:hypothetical protein